MAQYRAPKTDLFKSPPKIAVIVSPGMARWGSCHTIGANLQKAYELSLCHLPAKSQIEFVEYGDKLGKKDLLRLAKSISTKQYSHLAFIDHWPPAFGLLRALFAVSKGKNLPAVLMHVYGDFTFYSTDMVSAFYLLRGHKTRPVCASHRQVSLVNRLLNTDRASIGYVPFPVDTKRFFPSTNLREQERQAQGWGKDDFVVLYTGRISMQKNVTLAITQFFEHLKRTGAHKSKTKFKFVLCGKYDDLGAPFFGNSPPASEYFFRVRSTMAEIDPDLGSVSYLGNFEAEKLNRIYNAADAFFSLSLHHDEDFGMSPAEALATGLPCALSDWGGYSSFASINTTEKKAVWLIPAGSDDRGLYFFEPTLRDALQGVGVKTPSASERLVTAKNFQKEFSIEAVSKRLVREIQLTSVSSVDGPSNIFMDLAKRAIDIKNGSLGSVYSSYSDPLYRAIYSAYHGMD